MKKISNIGTLLKKIYRVYSSELLILLEQKGFTDLRPSFLEVLLFICEHDGPTIKKIGQGCGLKKQTMTSHLNELERRGYIKRAVGEKDKREQNIFLTEYGEKFRLNLFDGLKDIEKNYVEKVGNVEIDRLHLILTNFHQKITQGREHICLKEE